MELNFREKFSQLYDSNKIKTKKSPSELESMATIRNFHLDCKYTKKKICTCKVAESCQNDKDFSNFLIALINDEIDIKYDKKDPKAKIKFCPKNDEIRKYEKDRNEKIDIERIKNVEWNRTKYYMRNLDETKLLMSSDYKEIEKSINDNKKICENCKTNIYENNYHKGWKNESGEFVLLCALCSKKYFNGALEIKFELNRKEEMIPINRNSYSMSQNTSSQIQNSSQSQYSNQFMIKQDIIPLPSSVPTKINFQVINTSRPVEPISSGTDLICSNRRCNRLGKKSDFLCCSKCEKYYHPACSDPPLIMKYSNRFKWLCADCKECQVCNQKGDSHKSQNLQKCVTCDRTFHQNCNSLITSPINARTYCTDCLNCKNCAKNLPIPSLMNQNDFLSIKGFRVCEECWKYYKNKHYCPKCLKVYKLETESSKIYCNKCLNWYHSECEGISNEEIKEKNKTKYSYTCSICKTC